MALRLFEKTLASVPAELHGLYEKQADGTFALVLSDLESYVAGLKSALAKCREEKKELKARFGVTPDGAEALSVFGGIPKTLGGRAAPDVRAGLLPRRATAPRGAK